MSHRLWRERCRLQIHGTGEDRQQQRDHRGAQPQQQDAHGARLHGAAAQDHRRQCKQHERRQHEVGPERQGIRPMPHRGHLRSSDRAR